MKNRQKRQEETERKVKILKEVVDRNKLKNSGISIDEMVEFLLEKNIEVKYV